MRMITQLPDEARSSIQRLVALSEEMNAEIQVLRENLPRSYLYSTDWDSIQQALRSYCSYTRPPLEKLRSNINDMKVCVLLYDAKRESPGAFCSRSYHSVGLGNLESKLQAAKNNAP